MNKDCLNSVNNHVRQLYYQCEVENCSKGLNVWGKAEEAYIGNIVKIEDKGNQTCTNGWTIKRVYSIYERGTVETGFLYRP
jgi:hypothetical protein